MIETPAAAEIPETTHVSADTDIAVVGMAGRFPDACDLDRFWTNLVAGHETIRPLSVTEYLAAGGDPSGLDDPYLVRRVSVVEGIDLFDADFFGYRPTEAEMLDPQHRLFLECCYHALEHAGHHPDRVGGLTGLYAGADQNQYFMTHVSPRLAAGRVPSVDWFSATLGNDPGVFVTRVAYELNLTGPAVSVQTTCSTSLVAVHLACQDLLNYHCDAALAGGASLTPLTAQGYRYIPDGPLSPDGHCRAFDAAAAGMVPGNGVGVVVLKRLADALVDGDHVWAVIKGSAINNDGNRKVGFTAPSIQGQVEVILAAQAAARVGAESIGYVEAHGSATPLGDPIEVAALTEAFRESTERRGYCALGSVKTNIGHLGVAAGIAGLIKTVFVLWHRRIPPSLHFQTPNPEIDFAGSPFYVNTDTAEWAPGEGPRRAAVSSLGFGGTNAHVVLEEAPAAHRSGSPSGRPTVLPLSARNPAALQQMSARLAEHLAAHPELDLADVAHTLCHGRREHPHRRAVVCRTLAEGAALLAHPGPSAEGSTRPQVAYLLPGGGAHHPRMGKDLYAVQPVFREQMDRAARILLPVLGQDIRTVLYEDAAPRQACSFPTLVATEYAMATLLRAHGVEPDALLGHSLGEYTAACLAGVLSLEEALPLVAERERLLERAGGSALSVCLSEEALRCRLTGRLSLAAVNAPQVCTVSGPTDEIEYLKRELDADRIEHHRVRLPGAAHSELLDAVLDDCAQALQQVTLCPPSIPFLSSLTGTWITDEQATSREYWLRQYRETVRFSEGVQTLHGELSRRGRPLLVEVGPGHTLAQFARLQLGQDTLTVPSMRHPKAEPDDTQLLVSALGALWSHGAPVRWAAEDDGSRRRVPLPGYPFQRRRYWIDVPPAPSATNPVAQRTVYVLPNGLRDDNYPTTRAIAARTRGPLLISDPLAATIPSNGEPSDLAERLTQTERRLPVRAPLEPEDAERTSMTDRLCALHAGAYLRRHGIGCVPGEEVSRAELLARLGIVPAYHKFLNTLLGMLASDGIVSVDPDTDIVRFVGDTGTAEEITELEKTLVAEYPDAAEDLKVLTSCVAEYDAVLGGTRSGTEVLRSDRRNHRSLSWTERLLSHGDLARYRSLIVAEVSRLVGEADGRPLRILEIGGGQGHLTWPVAEALRGSRNVEYRFTDLGRCFVVAAQREATDRGLDFMTFGVLDLDRGPGTQGSRDNRDFDIVLFNVLPATPNLRRAVGNLRELLVPGGVLYILAVISTPRIATMTVGLLEGWRYFDDDFHENSPLLLPHRWQQLLSSLGFRPTVALPDRDHEATADHGLIVGVRPLPAAADTAVATTVVRSEELRSLGATVTVIVDSELLDHLDRRDTPQPIPASAPVTSDEVYPPVPAAFNRRPDLATAYTAPTTELEQLVARQWAEALGLDRVGVHDNFFDLGGESLLVIQMASRLRDELSVDLSVQKLFENLTVAEVVREIEHLQHAPAASTTKITPSRRRATRR
ncbi:MAG TPA: beta-ketoacyl synthase N-terminal-like domain-containing protein [Pseudonocardiaceae bacterium]|nr:beta-ketoacyl synthase N-terminal-like domain-containing protein [Pseudonocardiaceae bacterium]